MITDVDTNILLDVLIPGAPNAGQSERALVTSLRRGGLIIGEAVYGELAPHFPTREGLDRFLLDTGIRLQPSGTEALYRAGVAWAAYMRRRPASLSCPRCGDEQRVRCDRCGVDIRVRQHVLADFLIGAHAVLHAHRLLTRDRGFYATNFPALILA